jgi:hypothetical protein
LGDWVTTELGLLIFRRYCQALKGEEPLFVLGTAFSFVHLLDDLREQNLRFELPPGSRVLETGGYKGRSRSLPKANFTRSITKHLGVPRENIVCEYGMSELSSQAYDLKKCDECRVTGEEISSRHLPPVSRHFYFPPWARAQVSLAGKRREVADGETV